MADRTKWYGGAVLVLGAAGLLIAAGMSTADTSDVDSARGVDLPDLVDAETEHVAELEERTATLTNEIDDLGSRTAEAPVRELQQQVEDESMQAGFTDVEGPGVTVTLTDAPVPEDLDDLPENTTPDDFVVHQQDVEAVVNALWGGGAEALQIMDRRITNVSAVRCVGNVIILDGQVYSPPFTITAIGSPRQLSEALEESDGVQVYRQWADYIGLGYAVEEHESVLLPAATRPATLTYAQPPDEDA